MVFQNALIPIPMYVYWQEVLVEVNKKLSASYKYHGYIAEVYRGTKRNEDIEKIVDGCISIVNNRLDKKGLRSKYPIQPRKKRVA